MEDKMTSSS